MSQFIGIIGGSGLYGMEAFEHQAELGSETPFGLTTSPLKVGKLGGVDVIFLARHGEGHVFNPTEVNYRANIWALKKAGVKAILAVGAVGSLKEEIQPGHMVVIDQFIDRTRLRPATFFENGIVAHVGMAHPVSAYLRELLVTSCLELGITCHTRGTYVCIEGPQFSTIAESKFYRSLGADVIGMTNLQEAKLAREAEIDYATLALATDYDCWHQDHEYVTTEEVLKVLNANIQNAQKILLTAVKKFDFNKRLEAEGVLKNAILTKRERIKPEVIERLRPIIGKYFE